MVLKVFSILIFLSVLTSISAFSLTADEIIEKVDENEAPPYQYFEMTMIIKKSGRELVKNFFGYVQQEGSKSFMEFTNPEDEGVKYLKIDNELWIYFPDADDTLKISGHMLRQGMMGSDISYEDLLENDELKEKYEAVRLEDVEVNEYDTYQIELNAKVDNATYERQVVFIEKNMFVITQVEMYARGGRLVKKMSMSDYKYTDGRYYPTKIIIQDMRRQNTSTTITTEVMDFNPSLPSGVFSLQYLER